MDSKQTFLTRRAIFKEYMKARVEYHTKQKSKYKQTESTFAKQINSQLNSVCGDLGAYSYAYKLCTLERRLNINICNIKTEISQNIANTLNINPISHKFTTINAENTFNINCWSIRNLHYAYSLLNGNLPHEIESHNKPDNAINFLEIEEIIAYTVGVFDFFGNSFIVDDDEYNNNLLFPYNWYYKSIDKHSKHN